MKNYAEYPDRELYGMVARGDENAFSELARRYEKFIYTVAFGVLRSAADAADASQDALLKLWRFSRSWRGDCEIKTWIYRIAKNAALDALRQRERDASVSFDDAFADAADASPTPEEAAEKEIDAAEVRRAVMSLSDAHREVIVMREFSGMSYREIADALETDIGTVKSRLSRARAELYEKLRDKFGK